MHNESDPEREVARALCSLPTEDARPYDWQEFKRRQARATPGRRASGAGAFAAASAFALAAVAVWVRLEQHADTAPPPAQVATETAAEEPGIAERWLANLPHEPAIVRVGTRADVLGLEDRIAQVDDLLTAGGTAGGQAAPLLALQRERARLVSSLVQVRYAETLANGSR